jgi:DNA-binding transcriptional LysR family regulator
VADLGICAPAAETLGDLQMRPYRVDRLVLIVPDAHRLAGLARIAFHEALDEDFVSMPHGTSIPKLCRAAAERSGKRLRTRIEVTSFEGVRNMVSAGLGVGVLPERSVLPYLESASIRVVALDDAWSLRPLVIVARNFDTLPMPARILVDHLEKDTALRQ